MKKANKTIESLIKMAVPPSCDKYVLYGVVNDSSRNSGKKLVVQEWVTLLN